MTAPPPTPNSPLKSPARGADRRERAGFGAGRGMRGILEPCPPRPRSPTRSRPCGPIPARAAVLLDVDGTLAPIVRHADDAHVPEPTRVAADRGRQALRPRRLRERPPGHDRAPDRLARLDHLRRQPRRRDAARRARRRRARPRGRDVGAAHPRASPTRALDDDELRRLRVRAEDKDVIAAFHWRGAPDEEAAEAAVREVAAARRGRRASSPTGAARCSRSARRSRSTRGAESSACSRAPTSTPRSTSATTDRPRRVRARCARSSSRGPARAGAVRRRALRRDAAGARGARPTCSSTARRACGPLLEALRRLRPRAVRRLPPDHRPAQRRRGDRARRSSPSLGATADERRRPLVLIVAGWWFVAALIGALPRPPRAGQPADRAPARRREGGDDDARAPARARSLVNRLWPLLLSTIVAGGARPSSRRRSPGSRPASRSSGRSRGAARTRRCAAIEERDGVTFFVEPSSPFRPLRLVRTPGFRREVPTLNGTGV